MLSEAEMTAIGERMAPAVPEIKLNPKAPIETTVQIDSTTFHLFGSNTGEALTARIAVRAHHPRFIKKKLIQNTMPAKE